MVDAGDTVGRTLSKEFGEEAMASIEGGAAKVGSCWVGNKAAETGLRNSGSGSDGLTGVYDAGGNHQGLSGPYLQGGWR